MRLLFFPWDAPLLPAAARQLVSDWRDGPRADMAGVVLALPGARAGRRLLELMVEESEREGLVLVPPRIITLGSLPELFYRPSRPLAGGALARIAWVEALAGVPREELSPLFPRLPEPGDLPGRAGLARILDSLHRTVGGGGFSFAEVAEHCRTGLLFDDADRWRLLGRIQERFHSMLLEAGRMDREEARIQALREGEVSLDAPLHLVGVAELSPILRRMLQASGTRATSLVHAPEEEREAFDSLGCIRREVWAERHLDIPEEAIAFVDGPGDQAAEVLRVLRELRGEKAPEDLTIGIPGGGSVAPFLEQRLSSYGIATRVAAGVRLGRTPPLRLLAAAAEYLKGRRFEALATLLRHPDLFPGPEGEEGPESADQYFLKHLPALVPPSIARDGEEARLGALLRRLESRAFLGGLQGTRPLSEWMPRVMELLAAVWGEVEVDPGDPRSRRTLEACQRVRGAAEELSILPPRMDPECSAHAALRLLADELQEESLPPEAEEEAVELVGWLELHLDDAPILILTGVNEPDLPESVGPDPFLPNSLRKALGLEDNERRLARDAYRLTCILASREQVRLLSGRRDAEGNPLRPSRLLLAGRGEEVPRRVLRFGGLGDGPSPPPAPPPYAVRPAPESAFRLPPEPWIPITRLPQPFPVTAFRTLLEDPFRWALEGYLGLEEVHDEARELDSSGFGMLAHRVLELFGRDRLVHCEDAEEAFRTLSRILDRVAGEWYGRDSLPAVPLQVEQLRVRLRAFARAHATRVGEGWRVMATEVRTPPQGVPFPLAGRPFFLSGRIDRLDFHPARGEWAVLDYKTGDRVPTPEKAHRAGGIWKDLQLPLYRRLLTSLRDVEWRPVEGPGRGAPVSLGYVRLPKEEDEVGFSMAEWTEEELQEAEETARGVLTALLDEGGVRFREGGRRGRSRGPVDSLLGLGALSLRREGAEEEEGAGEEADP